MNMSEYKLYNGDCLEVMDKLIEEGVKVDAIITDPPYGTTACKWDSVIPFDKMWERLNKIVKDNGAIVLFGSQPFTSNLVSSNIKSFKYEWVWDKNNASNYPLAKKQPLKIHENIVVFSNSSHKYFPQGLIPYNKIKKRGSTAKHFGDNGSLKTSNFQEFTNYPKSILYFTKTKSDKGMHPTQKPVDLLEYLIKTYTNEGETVLDFTMGSGSTGVAALNTNRNFIGIELDKDYYDIAVNRLQDARGE